MKPKILVTCKQMQVELPVHYDRLVRLGFDVEAPPLPGQQFSSNELSQHMAGVVGLIAGDDELDGAFFAAARELRVLVRWGIGTDSVDHEAAASNGVVVRNTPGVFNGEVADAAVAYMLLCARSHHLVDRGVRAGEWPKVEGISLSGEVAGIVGLGGIGTALSARLRGFGMELVGYDPYAPSLPDLASVERVDLETLLRVSRFVVLTCPLTPETFHLIDAGALAVMRSDAFLVNVARGSVVDERALEYGLHSGEIAGAALDVFEIEPLPGDSPLRSLDQVILGAHNGSNARQGVARASRRAVDILLEELHIVSP